MAGSPRRFAREDVVELMWRIAQPALDAPGPVHPYFRGEWGPAQADRILDGDSWYEPS
jgi:glucose-6-phosphate 1-dehydrogenase